MSTQERWDIAIKALNGPLVALGEQVFRGPVVRIGANPGPGGLQLNGYRGLDARHCVITAYTGGTASVAPVGTNQVRLAPHPNVNWREIDPISGPEYLSEGCALHLGPIGRGATMEFIACRRLGVWQRGQLASEVADVPQTDAAIEGGAGPVPMGGRRGPVPASYDVRKVGRVRTSTAPFWFIGCLSLMATSTSALVLAIGGFAWLSRQVEPLGPVEEGYEFYESVVVDTTTLNLELFKGMQKPFYEFVMAPNITAAGSAYPKLDKPENWDQRYLQYVTASVEAHVRAMQVFRRLEAIKSEYGRVVTTVRASGMPEIIAAIPYQESRYKPDLVSIYCASGFWQFMPEVAHRVEKVGGQDFKVRDCRIRGTSAKWNPQFLAPPPTKRADYVDDDTCLIESCDVDDRGNLEKSTRAAMWTLGEVWKDPVVQRSGAAVQLTILSHNIGYDDSKWDQPKAVNLMPALTKWVKQNGQARAPLFYGENILCPTHTDKSYCGAVFGSEAQHYAYTITAQHFLAVCYYAQNYGEEAAFKPWIKHVMPDGYCRQFKIPNKDEVRRGGVIK